MSLHSITTPVGIINLFTPFVLLLLPLFFSDLGSCLHICLSHSVLIFSMSLGIADTRIQKPEWQGKIANWIRGRKKGIFYTTCCPSPGASHFSPLLLRQRQDLTSNQTSQMSSPQPDRSSKMGLSSCHSPTQTLQIKHMNKKVGCSLSIWVFKILYWSIIYLDN